jgi:Cd(II)/Pb(II)-responsive transcriptional regulator
MRIGELARVAATQVETVRYYEKQGLLPPPARSEGNYRVYAADHVERLRFIRHCRGLDMSLDEIRVLLRVQDTPADECGDVNTLLDQHIGHVVDRIRELRGLERQLRALRARCGSATDAAHCGILSELSVAARDTLPEPAPRDRHLSTVHPRRRKA